jgi:SAM-dependent methyltransferase
MPGIFRRLIQQQIAWSKALDRRLPPDLSIDARKYFHEQYLGQFIAPRSRVYDVGGGRYPSLTGDQKTVQNLQIFGVDLSTEELAAAPPGVYDHTVAADITRFQGNNDGDSIVCETVIEHVKDTSKAFAAFHTILKPGGLVIMLVPCRTAIFARLNRVLPESWKRYILNAIYPTVRGQGWPAYYDRCTPSEFRTLATARGFDVVHLRLQARKRSRPRQAA